MKVKDLFLALVVAGAALVAYDNYGSGSADAAPLQAAPASQPVPVTEIEDRSWIKTRDSQPAFASAPPASSKCDGRTRCPQMTSCAEARHFIQNCPNTAMDGDRDGIPCEDQWCR